MNRKKNENPCGSSHSGSESVIAGKGNIVIMRTDHNSRDGGGDQGKPFR